MGITDRLRAEVERLSEYIDGYEARFRVLPSLREMQQAMGDKSTIRTRRRIEIGIKAGMLERRRSAKCKPGGKALDRSVAVARTYERTARRIAREIKELQASLAASM